MTDTPPQPPAGWYPDQSDASKEVYWDGSTWTNARRPKEQLVPATEPAAAPKKRKILVDAPVTSARQAGPEPAKGAKLWVGIIAFIAFIAFISIVWSNGDSGSPAPDVPAAPVADIGDEYEAWDVCQQNVDKRLKAPATAGYPMRSEFDIIRAGETYRMRAWVDSENSFGAQIRTYFTCEVTHTTGDYYETRVTME